MKRANTALVVVSALMSSVLVASRLPAADSRPSGLTHADVSYGPHPMNVLDFWRAEGG